MKKLAIMLFFLSSSTMLSAQEKTIKGVVSDPDGAIIGATVKEKGTTTGTITDLDGKYIIKVSGEDAILVFSFVGKITVEKPVKGLTTIDVTLQEGVKLEEFVVTAVGVKREEKALGYSVAQMDGDALRETGQNNLINSLSGQVAGANVTSSSGTAGSGSRIVLRGETSLIGNNQALIVIDGVRVDNSEIGSSTFETEGVSNSNRAIDINQEDIESVTVLKGGAASALYGIEGANGVVLITTKKGKSTKGTGKPFDVNVSSSFGFSRVNKLPELQSTYSQGTAWFDFDMNGVGVPTYYAPESGWLTSWGPAMSDLSYDGATDYLYDKNGRIVLNSDPTAKTPANVYDNAGSFFRTGFTNKNNVSISGGGEIATYRFSLGNTNEQGIVPNNTFDKLNIGVATSITLLDNKLTLANTANFSNSKGHRIQQGSNTSGVMLGLLRTPVSFDNANGFDDPVDEVTAYTNPDGTQRNFRGGGGYDNPWWTVNNNPYEDEVNRILGSFVANYKFSDLLNLGTKFGYDTYTDRRQNIFSIGSRTKPNGYVLEETYDIQQFDLYLTLNGQKYFDDRKYGISYMAGVNTFFFNRNNLFAEGEGFAFLGFPHISNAATQTAGRELLRHRTFSYFGSLDLSFKDFVYLTLTGRQDYDSRLLDPNKEFKAKDVGFFYPSASVSYVFSENLDFGDKLSFGKIRVSWASIAKGPTDYYVTGNSYSSGTIIQDGWTDGVTFPFNGQTSYLYNNEGGTPDLKPEESEEIELGTDLKFFQNRLEFSFSYYNRKTIDAIVPVKVSGATGLTDVYLNSGKLTTNGIEARVGGSIVKRKNFVWKSFANFTKYKTMVDALAPGLEQLFVGGFTGSSIEHIPGQEFGQLYGGAFLEDVNGNVIIDDDPTSATYGYPLADPVLKVIGNPNPDFILGITNNFTYKGWNLSFLFDMKVGGEMWNGTEGALTFFGMSKSTEDRDQPGETSTVFEGNYGHLDASGNLVHFDGATEVTGPGSSNTTEVGLNEDWYTDNGGGFGSVTKPFIQDASFYRLRNVTLSYTFPKKMLKKSKILDGASVYVTGNNVFLITPYNGIDPETSLTGGGNSQGIDYFNMPNTRSFTFGVRVSL